MTIPPVLTSSTGGMAGGEGDCAAGSGGAALGADDLDRAVVVAVIAVRVVKMALHEVINVVAMHDGGVAATGAVLVGMVGVKVRVGHGGSFRSPDADA
jgi:hypothetical protein